MSIDDWRSKIDRIDDQLLILLNIRASCSIHIGQIKQEQNTPVHSVEREKEILSRLSANNPGPLDEESIKRLFKQIIEESRYRERTSMQE
jgi:chorismate mutase